MWGLPKVPYCLLRPVIYAHGNVWRRSCRGSRSEGAKVEEEEEESRGGGMGEGYEERWGEGRMFSERQIGEKRESPE